ncbi:hypothetical protein E4U41_001612 [Claviceps citrina]|nr:hypothetical protein E4U41_001612 [Claviceps citrina]
MTWTLFSVSASAESIIAHAHNEVYRSTEVDESDILHFTTDHMPKNPSAGFVFGTDKDSCDVLLHPDQSTGISGQQFAVTFRTRDGAMFLKDLSPSTTMISIDGQHLIYLTEERFITQMDVINVYLPNLVLVLVKGIDEDVEGDYVRFLDRLGSIPPNLSQLRLSSVSSVSNFSALLTDPLFPYCFGHMLGNGTSADVHVACHRRTGAIVAVKCFASNGGLGALRKEARTLRSLHHDHIIKYHESYDLPNENLLVMEYAPGGNLQRQVESSKFNDLECRTTVYQILDGLSYLHEEGITHRRLNPLNILVMTRQPMHIKIAGFGASLKATNNMRDIVRDRPNVYVAPEIQTPPYTEKVDIWSVGVIALELWAGLPNYNQDTCTGNLLCLKATTPPVVREFLEHLLQEDPNNRSSARLCLSLPLVTESRGSCTTAEEVEPETERGAEGSQFQATRRDNDEGIPNMAIWNPAYFAEPPVRPFEMPDMGFDFSAAWNPINTDTWFPGYSAPPVPTEQLSAGPLPAPDAEAANAPAKPVPEKPRLYRADYDRYDFLLFRNAWIAHDIANGTVNVTQILRAAGVRRKIITTKDVKNLIFRNKTGLRRISPSVAGTFVPYRDAVLVCQHLQIEESFLQTLV